MGRGAGSSSRMVLGEMAVGKEEEETSCYRHVENLSVGGDRSKRLLAALGDTVLNAPRFFFVSPCSCRRSRRSPRNDDVDDPTWIIVSADLLGAGHCSCYVLTRLPLGRQPHRVRRCLRIFEHVAGPKPMRVSTCDKIYWHRTQSEPERHRLWSRPRLIWQLPPRWIFFASPVLQRLRIGTTSGRLASPPTYPASGTVLTPVYSSHLDTPPA